MCDCRMCAGYAYSQLLAAGAPPIRPGETGRGYVGRALLEGPFRKIRHPGNLAYVTQTTLSVDDTHGIVEALRAVTDR